MKKAIINGRIITPQQVLDGYTLLIEDGLIGAIQPHRQSQSYPDYEVLDAAGAWLAPGLIDIHIHGSLAVDTMDASHSALDTLGSFLASRGVTAYLPTTGSAPAVRIQAVLDNFAGYRQHTPGAVPLGLHLEGPYLNPARKGAQPAAFLSDPQPGDYRPWLDSGLIRLVTLAPELPGALEMIEYGAARGVAFAAGHTTASYEQLMAAVDKGLRQVTHLFNSMEPLHHRHPGVVGGALSETRIGAQLIADGLHVHPAVVKLAYRAKGADGLILISDAMRAAGLPDGQYELLSQPVTVSGGAARISDGSLAGSTLSLDQAVRNMIEFCGISLPQALSMASLTPARALGIDAHKGQLTPGADADMVMLDDELQVLMTLVGGKVVYQRDTF